MPHPRDADHFFLFSACLSAGEGAWILRGAEGREATATGTTRAGVEADRPAPRSNGRSFVLSARCSGLKRAALSGSCPIWLFADHKVEYPAKVVSMCE